MDKEQITKAFNKHFLEFVDDVLRVFPESVELKEARGNISKVMILFPKMVIKLFKENVVDIYQTQVEAGDIDFFVNNDYKNDVTRLGYTKEASGILEKIDCLRAPIRAMAPADLAKAVKYLQNLTKLSLLKTTLPINRI